jgi:hypothetical protein
MYDLIPGSKDAALKELERKVNKFVKYVVDAGGLPPFMLKSLKVKDGRLGTIYGQPKIHKGADPAIHVGYTLRAMCANTAHPCTGLSKFVDKLLKPLLSKTQLKEMVVDTTDFLADFEELRNYGTESVNASSKPFTLDVVNMFQSMPIKLVARLCSEAWDRYKA